MKRGHYTVTSVYHVEGAGARAVLERHPLPNGKPRTGGVTLVVHDTHVDGVSVLPSKVETVWKVNIADVTFESGMGLPPYHELDEPDSES